jgi:CRISPR-associated protein Cas1
MIKRTLYFGNPAYLKTAHEQLIVQFPSDPEKKETVPIEDIGLIVLDHGQITITQCLMARLLEQNVALVTCDGTHHPAGMFFVLEGNTLQSQKHQAQVNASLPLRKQLWQQTVIAKICNQAALLKEQRVSGSYLTTLATKVKSGDSGNEEAKAASYYWKRVFPEFLQFSRDRFGTAPNNLLNYGYAILRAMVARAIVGSGLLPTLGIHHRNQYNAFCLADDIMEPYRPYVDQVVCEIVRMNGRFLEMTPTMKRMLLEIPAIDVHLEGRKSPLMVAVSRTTASLARCFEGEARKIIYPDMKPLLS